MRTERERIVCGVDRVTTTLYVDCGFGCIYSEVISIMQYLSTIQVFV